MHSASFFDRAKLLMLMLVCAALPMRASYIYVFSALLLLLWLVEGGLRQKLASVLNSKICLVFFAYFAAYLVAMLWTENTAAGWFMVKRQIPFLLFFLYWSSAKMDARERYISAFLIGLCICAVFAYYNWMQLNWFPDWPRGVRVDKSADDTAPFVDRIMYAPMLALGGYLSLRRAAFAENWRAALLPLLVGTLLTINLSFSGGRAGMVMFLALCVALIFERFQARLKALICACVVLPLMLVAAYHTQSYFAQRVDYAVADLKKFPANPNTSLGLRLVYWTTSARLFLEHPLLGVGTGDFKEEYGKLQEQYWPGLDITRNPHNQYLFTATTTGVLGLATLAGVFFLLAAGGSGRTRAVLLGFAVVCLFESYLWRSNTALAFVVLLAVLRPPENRPHPGALQPRA